MFLYIIFKYYKLHWGMVKMDVRKLISFGKNSHIVSLPKSWVDRNKLKKGDLISIHEISEGLILKTGHREIKEEPRSIVINAEDKDIRLVKAEIITAYLNSYDTIEIISKKLDTNATQIKDVLMDLAGLEILEQTTNRFVAKDLININEISIKSIIRRMDIITRSMIEDAIKCVDASSDPESIHQRDADVNRLHFLAYRVIRKALSDPRIAEAIKRNPLQLQCDESIIMRIEKVADRQKRIARYVKGTHLSGEELEKLKKIYSTIQQAYLDVMKAYYNNDIQLAYKVELSNRERINACNDFLTGHTHCDLQIKGKKGQKCDYRMACASTALILENLKAMATSVKYIARTVLGGE